MRLNKINHKFYLFYNHKGDSLIEYLVFSSMSEVMKFLETHKDEISNVSVTEYNDFVLEDE